MTPDEIAYHQHVLTALRNAEAAWRSWASWLAAKYQLGPRDTITESGEVERAPVENPPEE